MMMNKLVGTVQDFGGIIAVSNDIGFPLHNFLSWHDFMKWLNLNHFDFAGNAVIKPVER
jgi:hypothetical protein